MPRIGSLLDMVTGSTEPAVAITQGRPEFLGRHYIVSSSHYLATMAGVRTYERGGNAADAGVAAGIALNVLERHLTDFGGVAPIMFYRPGMSRPETIDGVGRWPLRLSLEEYRAKHGSDMPPGAPRFVTPAAPDAWLTALARYGRLSLEEVLQPAMELCHGFPVFPRLADALAKLEPRLSKWPASARVFLPHGRSLKAGDILVQKDLAMTFQRLIEAERRARSIGRVGAIMAARDLIYTQEIARQIADFAAAQGSLLDAEDLSRYRVRVEPSAHSTYRGVEVHVCGAWSQGPVVPMLLNLLEGFDIAKMNSDSVSWLHCFIECVKLVFADREGFFGDPEVVDVPIQGLLSKGYAAQRRQMVDISHATPGLPVPGDPWVIEGRPGRSGYVPHPTNGEEHPDTSYVCALDAEGNAFSATPSDPSLSAPLIEGLGFTISTRGAQFWLDPDHPSVLAPGKRPRLTPNPAILVRSGRAVMPFGCPGGDAQGQAMVQVVCNIVDFGMNVQAAIEAPRAISASFPWSFHPHPFAPNVVRVEGRIPQEVRSGLSDRGHEVELLPDFTPAAAAVCAVLEHPDGVLEGGADPRLESYAAGW